MITVFITVSVGAIIGFGTNLIAIIMLFRPWSEKRIFGVRLPLTPGLIPKRQGEIARKLGEVVEEHLLTREGIVSALRRPEWLDEMSSRIMNGVESVLAKDPTFRDLLCRFTGQTTEELAEKISEWMHAKPIKELLPVAVQNRIEIRIDDAAEEVLDRAKVWIESEEVRQFIATSIQERLLDSGVLGKMAMMLMQEDKLVGEIVSHLKKWMDSPASVRFLQDKMRSEWDKLLESNTGDVLRAVGNKLQEDDWLEAMIGKEWSESILNWNVHDWFTANQPRISHSIGKILARIQQSSSEWVHPLLKSIGIRRIVEEQVASFPLPKLEKLVVGVVKKELQMITWLGAVLGGLIGLVQAVLLVGYK